MSQRNIPELSGYSRHQLTKNFMCKTGLSFSFAHTHKHKQTKLHKLQMILCEPGEIASDMLISEHHWDWHLSQRAWTVRNASTDFTKWNAWGKKICTMAWKEGSSDNLSPSLSLFLPNKLSFFLSYCLWCTCRPVSPRVHVCGVCVCPLENSGVW